jgi:hypothetical protein
MLTVVLNFTAVLVRKWGGKRKMIGSSGCVFMFGRARNTVLRSHGTHRDYRLTLEQKAKCTLDA